MDDKDKDNPHTDDDPPLSTKVHLGSSNANDSPGSRDFDTPYLLASSNSKASRFSPISVTMAPLTKPTDEVMNTTMDQDSLGTPPPGDPGGDDAVDNKDKDKDNPGGDPWKGDDAGSSSCRVWPKWLKEFCGKLPGL